MDNKLDCERTKDFVVLGAHDAGGGKTIFFVPLLWLQYQNGIYFWPPKCRMVQMETYVKNKTVPNVNWQKYRIETIYAEFG